MSLREPFNTSICQGDGTIFSSPSGGSSGGGTDLEFINLSENGAKVFLNRINDVVQFRPLRQGNNVQIVENPDHLLFNVNDLAFDSSTPIKRNVSGLLGITLGKTTILDTIRELLYPILPPTLSLGLSVGTFEYGDATNFTANWGVTRTDENILTISVNNVSIGGITGNTQNGNATITKNGLGNVNVPMQATTATRSASTSATAVVARKLRFGPSSKNGGSQALLDSDINNLTGQFSGSYKLSPTTVVIGVSQYLVIAIPASLLGANIPTFRINGFVNNAFNLARSNSFTNSFGYAENTNVYVSNAFATGNLTLEIA